MDQLRDFLEAVRQQGSADSNLLGLLHVLIGRRVTLADGTLVSAGLSWRDVAALLKRLRWAPEAVRQLGIDPASLPPRDRQRFWYMAIAAARVDSAAAAQAGDALALAVSALGYQIGPPPRTN